MIAKSRIIIKFVEIVKKIVSRAYQILIKAGQKLSQLLPNKEQIGLPRNETCRFLRMQLLSLLLSARELFTLETDSQAALKALSVSM